MAMFRIFKVPKHQRFDYKPRFYDQDKEELQERLQQSDLKKQDGVEATKARISSGLRRKGGYNKMDYETRRRQIRQSNLRLLVMVGALIVLVYLVLNLYLPKILVLFD